MTTQIRRCARAVLGAISLILLAACSPPDQKSLDLCRKSAAEAAAGRGLTANDMGELVEACMSKHGFALKKTGKHCSHDLQSQGDRRCYFPDTMLGRANAWTW